MSRKHLKRGTVVAVGLLMALLLCLTAIFASGIVFVSAEGDGSFTGYSSTLSEEKLYNATNTYSYNGANPYDIGTEEYRLYEYFNVNGNPASVAISDTPQITVLTHGLGGNAAHWSNNGKQFSYSATSIVAQIDNILLDGAASVYWAKMTDHKKFSLIDIKDADNINEDNSYKSENDAKKIEKLTDVSKHIIIIFEATSVGANGYNNETYEEFNYMLSKIVYDVKYLSGKLPKINLIGHSRGGITNLQYALDHPSLVGQMFSLGTPYFGSTTGSTELGAKFCAEAPNGLSDIITDKVYLSYYERYMNGLDICYKDLNVYALGGYSSVNFVFEVLKNDNTGTVESIIDKNTLSLFQAAVNMFSKWAVQMIVDVTYKQYSDLVRTILQDVEVKSSGGSFTNLLLVGGVGVRRDKFYMNDLLVDLPSQLGVKNDKDYGFIVYQKCFTDSSGKCSNPNQMPVVHNLEAQDADFINYIVRNIEVGSGKTGFIYDVKDDGNAVVYGYRGSVSGMNTFEVPGTVDGFTVTEIGSHAFDGVFINTDVTKIIIPNTVTTIGNHAFYRCSDLSTIEFANGSNLQTIEEAAYAGCSSLETMNLPASLTQIGQSAFEGTALSSFTISSNLTDIGQYAFLNCEELTGLTQDGVNPNYAVENGVLYNADKTELLVYPAGKETSSFTVPDSVTEINAYAIYGNPHITSLDLNQVASIGYYGLAHNSSLGTISGGNLLSLESDVVEGTAWLENQTGDFVALGDMLLSYRGTDAHLDLSGYKSIASFAVASNSTLESVTFGNDTTSIGNFAFLSCDNLSRVNLYNVNQIIFAGSGSFGEDVDIMIPQCLEEDYLANEIWNKYSDQFVIQETTVHFTSDGQAVCPDGTLKYYEPIGELPVPSKTGHVFENWHYTLNGTDTVAQQQDLWLLTEDEVSFTAEWSLEEYDVVYHLNGGTYDGQDGMYIDHYTMEDTVTFIVPTYSGYTFAGWYYDAELTEYAGTQLTAGNIGDFELYAKWEGNEYNILFELNDDEKNPAEYIVGNDTVTYGCEFTFNVPTRTGYTFDGWMTEDGVYYTDNLGIGNRPWDIESDTTLYAHWTAETYYLRVNAIGDKIYWLGRDGFTEDQEEAGIPYGTEFDSFEAVTFAFAHLAGRVTKEGYKFSYFTDVKEIDYEEIVAGTKDEPKELDAQKWDRLIYDIDSDEYIIEISAYYAREAFEIRFEGTGAEDIEPILADFGTPIPLPSGGALPGRTFSHWIVAEDLSNNKFKNNKEDTKFYIGAKFNYSTMPDLTEGIEADNWTIVLSPVYTPNTYTITFFNQYGNAPGAHGIVYGTKSVLPVPSAVNGRTFAGWYTGSNKSGTQITNSEGQMLEAWTIADNAVLYAGYNPINYIITFVENGGTSVDDISYNIDTPTFDLPETTTRSGYRFMGWYDNSGLNGTRVDKVPQGSTGNKTFYADWSYLYTITFKNNGVTVKIMTGIKGEPIVLEAFNQSKVGHTLYWDGEYEVGYEYTIVGNKTFQAEWEANTYTVTLMQEGDYRGLGGTRSFSIKYGEAWPKTIELPKRKDCITNGYYYSDYKESNLIYDYNGEFNRNNTVTGSTYRFTSSIILKLEWSLISCEFVIDKIAAEPNIPVTVETFSWSYGGIRTCIADDTFSYDGKKTYGFTKWIIRLHGDNDPDLTGNPWRDFSTDTHLTLYVSQVVRDYYPNYRTGDGPIYIRAVYNEPIDECITPDSLITLADGTQKAVAELKGDEMLLVWNMATGTLDVAPILFIDNDPVAMYSVINLYFSDGTQVKVISEHGFWDYNLNKYVYLDKDAAQYIGHWFNKLSIDENGNSLSEKVQLVNVVIQDEYTTAWSPVTYGHLCYYVNGMLSMPGGIEGMFNIFEVDAETMKYDEAQMQADIAQYGLFTYEEFAELFPVSEEVFEAFNGQYLKVAMGKGLIDAEGLQTLIERYAEFLSAIE